MAVAGPDPREELADLVRRLKDLGKGIGDVTAGIFLRELRGIWDKADPPLSERAIKAARALALVDRRLQDPGRILKHLQAAWLADGKDMSNFTDFEAALVRYAARLRRHGRTGSPSSMVSRH